MIDAIEIGYAIKERRAKLGLTQAQLAEAAGISKRCLWSLELGQNPGVQLDKLTAVLGTLGLDLAISTTDVAEPIEPIAGTASTVLPSAQPESHTAADTTASAVAGTMPASSSQHASRAAFSIPSDTTKVTASNTSDANASGSIDALSILTGGRQ